MSKLREAEPFDGYIPIGENIVVRQHEAKEMTEGGMIIPDQAQSQPLSGDILAVGTEVPLEIEVGQCVRFPPYGGTPVAIDDQLYKVMHWKVCLLVYTHRHACRVCDRTIGEGETYSMFSAGNLYSDCPNPDHQKEVPDEV